MKKKFPVLFMIATFGSLCAAFVLCFPTARAYEIPSAGRLPVPPVLAATGSSQGYGSDNSFNSLVSPFTNFFNSMRGGNTVPPMTLNVGGGDNPSAMTISINVQQYVNQYTNDIDAWFYQHTGVHVQWVIMIFVNFVYWLFGLANAAVRWIVGLFH
jgi:hypothetical protein